MQRHIPTDAEKQVYLERSQSGPCFICEILAGRTNEEHAIIYEDDRAIVFLNRYPTLYGYTLVAPRQHVEHVTGDLALSDYLALQRVIYRAAEALRQELLPERVYILSLGSQQGNRHVHWHIAPLPAGVPYEQQQLEALQMSRGILQLSREEQNDLACRLRQRMQRQEFSIRPAGMADCQQLAQVQVDSYQNAYRGLFPDDYLAQLNYGEQEQDWRAWLSDHPQETFLVAELPGGQIGGYVRGAPGSELAGFDCELAALHVRQEQQGRGLGRALLQEFSQCMRAAGCQRMMLWVLAGNLAARQFYEHLGGRTAGEKRWQMDTFEVVEAAYGWNLSDHRME